MPWTAKPLPGEAKLLGDALRERATVPAEMARGARAAAARAAPRRLAAPSAACRASARRRSPASKRPRRTSPFNVEIGPHRRYTFVDADLGQFKAIKDSARRHPQRRRAGGRRLGLGRYLRREGIDTDGLELKAMVPVSVRADSERGALGNQVAAMWAPLPVDVRNPAECLQQIARGDGGPQGAPARPSARRC